MRYRVLLLILLCSVLSIEVFAARSVPIDEKTIHKVQQPVLVGTRVTLQEFDLVGRPVTLEMESFDVWAADATVRIHAEDGQIEEVEPERRTYYGGRVVGDDTSLVFLSVGSDIRGLIIADDVKYVVRTHSRSLMRGRPLVYVEEVDVSANMEIESGWECDVDRFGLVDVARRTDEEIKAKTQQATAALATSTARYQAGIYIETDFELYGVFGSSSSALTSWLGDLVAASTVIYNRDLVTVLTIAGTAVYTSSGDPWTNSTDNSVLLGELGDYWQANHPTTPRSAVMLMSGKSTGGGVAWIGTIGSGDFLCSAGNCGNPTFDGHYGGAYGVCGSITNTPVANPNDAVPSSNYWGLIVFSHELGHIVNSGHTHCTALSSADTTTYGRPWVDECVTGCTSNTTSLPAEKGTVMSYCHLRAGGAANLRYLFGKSGEASYAIVTPDATYDPTGTPRTTVRGRLATRSPNPSAITAPASLAAGAAGAASISALGGVTYAWTVTNGTINSGQGTNSINFTATTDPVTVKIVVTETVTHFMAATDSVSVTVTGSLGAVRSDFNGDGKSDITWRNQDIYDTHLWMMNGTAIGSGGVLPFAGSAWNRLGTGDLNGDQKADLMWRHSSGEAHAWFMNGAAVSSGAVLPGIGSDWSLGGIGDFDGDGKDDLIWSHTSGETHMWLMNGGAIASGAVLSIDATQWDIAVTGDFNGDGKDDLVLRNKSTYDTHMWFMNGTVVSSGAVLPFAGSEWSLKAAGDFNGDGKDDLVWRYVSTGETHMWFMNGAAISSGAVLPGLTTDWELVHVGDYNGDGKFDLVWRYTTGEAHMWLMNGGTISSGAVLPGISSVWTTIMESQG